jgi:flagellar hook-associated protein 3 FlgL
VSTRVTTGMLQRNILADLNRQTTALTRTQDKLSSGKEISRPSDDPAGASKALMLREGLRGTQQYQRNVTDGISAADATETSLSSMSDLVQTARELVVQAGNDSYDATSRASIKTQILQIADALKEQANTKFAGRFLFSGTKTDTAPYASGTDTYQGDTGGVAREIGPGVSVNINTTADSILGGGQAAGDDKLLAVLHDVADHLDADDADSLRGTDLTRIDANLDNLSQVRANNGALTNRLESAQTRLASVEEITTKGLSNVEDVDYGKAMIDFSTQSAAYQAALKAGANMVQSSLMDFLR